MIFIIEKGEKFMLKSIFSKSLKGMEILYQKLSEFFLMNSRLRSMLFQDVNNGISRRTWARNEEGLFTIKREMERTPGLKVTLPEKVDDRLLKF